MYHEVISLENLFKCWDEFKRGKVSKPDVMRFERYLEDNIFQLHHDLSGRAYRHQPYVTFNIYDPKHRVISKATVRDRLVHHVVFQKLYEIFDPTFIFHSYSSRIGKGTHLAVQNLARALRKESRNYTRHAFVLKCDIRKFFNSVDHRILLQLIQNKIKDTQFLWLVHNVIRSFPSPVDKIAWRGGQLLLDLGFKKRGLPIGNLTSQILANIYLNELDQFVTRRLHVKRYFRYADDFAIVHHDTKYLARIKDAIERFLATNLDLALHPDKVEIRKFTQGVDFLGYVVRPHHIVLRTKTKKRMFTKLRQKQDLLIAQNLSGDAYYQSLQSYLGLLMHCNAYELTTLVENNFGSTRL